MKDVLKDAYHHCMEMQRLAEAKNAGLIAFNGGLVACMVKLCLDGQVPDPIRCACGLLTILSLAAMTLAFLAVGPILRHGPLRVVLEPGDNLQFFGHIAGYTKERYLEELHRRYFPSQPMPDEHDRDAAAQVVCNAQIALRKFRLFDRAFATTLVGFAVATALILMHVVPLLGRLSIAR